MKTIVLKNVPDELHARLKERAKRHHRSLNGEVIALLEEQVEHGALSDVDRLAILREIRESKAEMPGPGLSIEEIEHAINEGRA
jgi:plasmid stability protein